MIRRAFKSKAGSVAGARNVRKATPAPVESHVESAQRDAKALELAINRATGGIVVSEVVERTESTVPDTVDIKLEISASSAPHLLRALNEAAATDAKLDLAADRIVRAMATLGTLDAIPGDEDGAPKMDGRSRALVDEARFWLEASDDTVRARIRAEAFAQPDPMEVRCPKCAAAPGRLCRPAGSLGGSTCDVHDERIALAAKERR